MREWGQYAWRGSHYTTQLTSKYVSIFDTHSIRNVAAELEFPKQDNRRSKDQFLQIFSWQFLNNINILVMLVIKFGNLTMKNFLPVKTFCMKVCNFCEWYSTILLVSNKINSNFIYIQTLSKWWDTLIFLVDNTSVNKFRACTRK